MPPLIGPQTGKRRRRAVSTGQASTVPASFALGRADRNLSPRSPGPGSRRATERAQTRLPQRPTPAIPDLPGRPTRAQARTIERLSRRSLQGQVPAGPGRAQRLTQTVRELQQDPRTRRRLAPVREATRTPMRNARVRTGMDMLRANPAAFGASPELVRGLHRLAVRNAIPEHLRSALAAIGSGVETRLPVRAKAGRPHAKISAGGVSLDLTQVGKTAGNLVAAGTSLDTGDLGPKNLVNRSLKDLGIIGTFPVLGGYQIGAAGFEAAKGDASRARALAKGVVEGIKEEVTHPGRAFTEHPVLTALDAAAALTVVGRGAGAVVRGVSGGRRASTVRPSLALVDDAGTRLVQQRRYSRDLIRREIQKAADSRKRELTDLHGRPVTEQDAGRTVPVLVAEGMKRDRLLRRQANFGAAQTDSVRRLVREQDLKASRNPRRGGLRGRLARDAQQLVAEGTVLTAARFEQDLRSHAQRLTREIERRDALPVEKGWGTSAKRAGAVARLEKVQRLLDDPKAMRQAQRIAERGIEQGARLRGRDEPLTEAGVLNEKAAHRAALMATAIEHLEARHFTKAEHRSLEQAARVIESDARRALDAADPAGRPAAQAALQQARENRIAISGRDPKLVEAHESARTTRNAARDRVKTARRLEQRAIEARARLVGVQSSRRGAKRAATPAERKKLAAADTALANAKTARREAEKQHKAAKDRLRATPMPDRKAGLRRADGTFLANSEIEAFIRSTGRDPATVAKVPHVMAEDAAQFGARSHYQQDRVDSRPMLGKESTTGELYRSGAAVFSEDLLRDAGVRQVTTLARAQRVDRFVQEAGLRHPAWAKHERGEALTRAEQRIVEKGGYFTGAEAADVVRRLRLEGSDQHMVAIRGFAASLPKGVRQMIRSERQGPAGMETLPQQLLAGRVIPLEDLGKHSARNVVLVPKEMYDQLSSHLTPAGPLERFFQMLNRPFRMAVLPQPRWLTGNFVEPYFVRLPGVGSGVINVPGMVRDIRIANRAVKMLRKDGSEAALRLADELEGHHLGGLFIGRRGASVRRTRDDFKTWGAIVRRMPVMDDVANVAASVYRFLTWPLEQFFKVNRKLIESPAQKAALGKFLRQDMQEIRGSWVEAMRASDPALRDALNGLVGTPAQERFMRAQHELLGKYEGFGPVTRRLVQSIAPFLPWALAAARFTYWTMPMHRTAQTALLIHTQQVVQQAWDAEHKDAPPGSLRLDPRNSEGGFVPLARYTPYGLTGPVVEGDPQGITDQFFPQVSGFVGALGGVDPFNRPLRGEPSADNPEGRIEGFLPKLGVGAYGLAEGLVPYLSTARRLREGGRTGYAGSTVWEPRTKEGTERGMETSVLGVKVPAAVRRTWDPFRPTMLRPPAAQQNLSPAETREVERLAAEAEVSQAQVEAELREADYLLRSGR